MNILENQRLAARVSEEGVEPTNSTPSRSSAAKANQPEGANTAVRGARPESSREWFASPKIAISKR